MTRLTKHQQEQARLRAALGCGLESVTLTLTDRVELHLPDGECTDMTGAIEYAEFMHIGDKPLRFVQTYSGNVRDTLYTRGHNGAPWRAVLVI